MSTVAVLGPGAVGGALAVRLALTGNRVVCVARRDAVEAISRDGLELVWEGQRLRARPEAVERIEEPVELLLLTVKAPALADALERVEQAPELALPLLNGLEHLETIRAAFGPRVAAGSLSRFEAYRDAGGRIVQTTPSGVLTIASRGAPLARATDLLAGTGLEVRVDDSEERVLWEKVARLAPLAALTAATQRTVGQLRSDPRLAAAIEEACAVANAAGVHTSPTEQSAIIDAMAPDLTTSTARDVAAGRPSELDAIVGAVVRAGRRLGVQTPTLEELLELCRA
jgi:2-dehydropantoate 2-reductase